MRPLKLKASPNLQHYAETVHVPGVDGLGVFRKSKYLSLKLWEKDSNVVRATLVPSVMQRHEAIVVLQAYTEHAQCCAASHFQHEADSRARSRPTKQQLGRYVLHSPEPSMGVPGALVGVKAPSQQACIGALGEQPRKALH